MKACQAGFTLVELVTVVALMVIMAAVATPRYVLLSTFDTRGNLGMVVSALRFAQKTAIAQHRLVYVKLDSVARNLQLCYDSTCTTKVTDPVSLSAFQLNFANNVTITGSQSLLGFTAAGVPVPNATTTYVVTNAQQTAQTNTVQVEADTGYIRQL